MFAHTFFSKSCSVVSEKVFHVSCVRFWFICSATGALAIFLRKSFKLEITTSDYDDVEIEENIAYNCRVNGVTPVVPHIRRKFFCHW